MIEEEEDERPMQDITFGHREEKPWNRSRKRGLILSPETIHKIIRTDMATSLEDLEEDIARMGLQDKIEDHRLTARFQRKRMVDTTTTTLFSPPEDIKAVIRQGHVPSVATATVTTGKQPPNEFGLCMLPPYQLYPHQIAAIRFAIERESMEYLGMRGCLLALEMGLGKTLISLSVILSQWHSGQGATLVVVPKTLMTNYVMDAGRFFGSEVNALIFDRDVIGQKLFFQFNPETYQKNHMIVVSYDTVKALARAGGFIQGAQKANAKLKPIAQIFFQTPWHRVVCDESHTFANPTSQVFRAMMALPPGKRLCLTGTAVRNYEDDLFTQLRFLGLNILQEPRTWTIVNYQTHQLGQAVLNMSVEDAKIELPPKESSTHYCEFDEQQKAVYNVFLTECQETLRKFKLKEVSFMHLLEIFTRLRQICISPFLLVPDSKHTKLTERDLQRQQPGGIMGLENLAFETGYVRNHQAGMQSAKMRELLKISETVPESEKMLVFSQWSSAVFLAQDVLTLRYGAEAVEIVTGETKDRDAVFTRFRLDPRLRFLVMTRVGGVGVTLTEANHAVLLCQSWTDVHNNQAIGRIWRIGQTKPCFVYDLVIKGSIESRMVSLCQEKHDIRDILMQGSMSSDVIGLALETL